MGFKKNNLLMMLPLAALAAFNVDAAENKKFGGVFAGFVDDSHADLSFRHVFKNLSTEDYGSRSNQTAWGQGITLDYQSGYINDMLGMDASYYGVVKLAASDDFWGRSVLYNDNGQAKGFNKLGQLYMKARLGMMIPTCASTAAGSKLKSGGAEQLYPRHSKHLSGLAW
ncbi:putative outer membrane porin protein [Serratia rubidaea]|uniref:Putative outer membrane porin protein n=1 Tax=Serratia rubidaea TaxID=61652 RepID=A0A3S4H5A5_SERRU|nr:putative outer membrane porin protein [Serratia rubidaea]